LNTAIWLVIPIILIRYTLLRFISKGALQRAAYFPSLYGIEKYAFYLYQTIMIFLILYLLFLEINIGKIINILGIILYILGIFLYIISILDFARPQKEGLNTKGLYSYSRNPMYVAFFIYFLGIALITESILYLAAVILFQISVHYLIISEERYCIKKFGEEYEKYMHSVNRYFGRKRVDQ